MELYAALKLAWWALLGLSVAASAVLMGGDMGVGVLLRVVGRNDLERRTCLNAIGPHWEGNQTWFVFAGGLSFAAFPLLYSTALSALYLPALALLWSMLLRPPGFEYRSKLPHRHWREAWDWAQLAAGALPMMLLGALLGRLLLGVDFDFDQGLRARHGEGSAAWLHPFALLCAALTLALAVLQGACVLMRRCPPPLAERARRAALLAAPCAALLFALLAACLPWIDGWTLQHHPPHGVAQTPLQQQVAVRAGGWLVRWQQHPPWLLLPLLAMAGMLGAAACAHARRALAAWRLAALAWSAALASFGACLFPFLLPSRVQPAHSLTLWNSSASLGTLLWMSAFAAVLLPVVVWYSRWCVRVMQGSIHPQDIEHDDHAY